MDVQLTYNTATGRTVIQVLAIAVFLLLRITTGTRGTAAIHRNTSVKVSSHLFIYTNVTVMPDDYVNHHTVI